MSNTFYSWAKANGHNVGGSEDDWGWVQGRFGVKGKFGWYGNNAERDAYFEKERTMRTEMEKSSKKTGAKDGWQPRLSGPNVCYITWQGEVVSGYSGNVLKVLGKKSADAEVQRLKKDGLTGPAFTAQCRAHDEAAKAERDETERQSHATRWIIAEALNYYRVEVLGPVDAVNTPLGAVYVEVVDKAVREANAAYQRELEWSPFGKKKGKW